jgi:hypothetical protein
MQPPKINTLYGKFTRIVITHFWIIPQIHLFSFRNKKIQKINNNTKKTGILEKASWEDFKCRKKKSSCNFRA